MPRYVCKTYIHQPLWRWETEREWTTAVGAMLMSRYVCKNYIHQPLWRWETEREWTKTVGAMLMPRYVCIKVWRVEFVDFIVYQWNHVSKHFQNHCSNAKLPTGAGSVRWVLQAVLCDGDRTSRRWHHHLFLHVWLHKSWMSRCDYANFRTLRPR